MPSWNALCTVGIFAAIAGCFQLFEAGLALLFSGALLFLLTESLLEKAKPVVVNSAGLSPCCVPPALPPCCRW